METITENKGDITEDPGIILDFVGKLNFIQV